MGSKYIDDLEAWVKAKAIKKPDANVAAFLAVRDLVKARLDDGYSATIIHDFLRAGQHIDICYDTFLKYVHRYVQPPRKEPKAKGRTARTVGHALGCGHCKHRQTRHFLRHCGIYFQPESETGGLDLIMIGVYRRPPTTGRPQCGASCTLS